jgi:haloalkane dehalogenase
MKTLRTPDSRFAGLADFPFEPNYVEVPSGDGDVLRMHYVDAGPKDADVVLMLHGEPSWSYLYRKVIRAVSGAHLRAVAPDLIGFGRSDKPAERGEYTYQRHVDWVWAFIEAQKLERITLLCQDWGGLIGLRLCGEHPERFARVIAANTFLPTGDRRPPDAFFQWQRFSQEVPELPIGKIVQSGCARPLPPEIAAAYEAPFPDESYKAGARKFPLLVPSTPDDPASPANRRAWESLSRFEKPFLTAFGDSDPVTGGAERWLQKGIPGAAGQPHVTLERAGHFLQEDAGEELGRVVVDFVKR